MAKNLKENSQPKKRMDADKENSQRSERTKKRMDADKENSQRTKKRKVSLSLSTSSRFKPSTSNEISSLETRKVVKNTESSSKWAIKNFIDWFHDYQQQNPDCPCPENILTPSPRKEDLNKYFTIFVSETRNHKGEKYPPRSVNALLSGILRSMRLENPFYPKRFDKSDASFKTFQTFEF